MDLLGTIISDATKCLRDFIEVRAGYIYHLEENVDSLRNKWDNLKDKKEDVKRRVEEAENTGESERIHEVDGWLNKVDGSQKAIDDILVQGPQEIQNKSLSECCPRNCMSSYRLGKRVAKKVKIVEELLNRGKGFDNVEIAYKLRPKVEEMPPEKTVGMELLLDKVWNSIDAENVGVIGLYGMGGAGKTALLKRINNEIGKRPGANFDVVMWEVVSKDPNCETIMENIRRRVGIQNDTWNHCRSQDEKARNIYKVLKSKKYVLLLDDMWEQLDLKMLGVPHPEDTRFKSKVLFTTRSKDVCFQMNAESTKIKVECLTEKEAFELFCKKVGQETLDSHPNIPGLARGIAAKCKGLPLALIVVGSAMSGVKNVKVWEHSKNDFGRSSLIISNFEKNVFSILKFSYDRLPDDTHRKCFLYCALFPEDYEIPVVHLIDKWIGEGFLCKDWTKSKHDMYGHGESVIEKLKLSCLLESVEDDVFLDHTVKMHNVIRHMALWLACDQEQKKNKILLQRDALATSQDDDEKWKLVERISVIDYDRRDVLHHCQNLLTLTISGRKYSISGSPNFKFMSKLKVLELSTDERVSLDQICYLINLEYLKLSGPIFYSDIPMELKKLKNLRIFSLDIFHPGDLAIIPLEVISSLEQLRAFRLIISNFFDEQRIREERAFLEKLESLVNLEELCIDIVTNNGLKKLLEPTKLQSCIRVLSLCHIKAPFDMQLLLASMSKMEHLQTIHFRDLRFNNVENSSIIDGCRLDKLLKVSIYSCHSMTHLTWLKFAPLLEELLFCSCNSAEEVIKEGTKDDEEKKNVDNIFARLVRLFLCDLPKLKSIHKTALPFPSLRHIQIIRCPNIKKLNFDSDSAKDSLRSIEGPNDWWKGLGWDDSAIKDRCQSKFKPVNYYWQSLSENHGILGA